MKFKISKKWCEASAKKEGDASVGAGLPSVLGLSKSKPRPSAFALARGCLWVPAAEILLLASIFRTVGETAQTVGMECARRGSRVKAAKERGRGAAWLLASQKIRRLVEEASVRQPTDNPAGEPRPPANP